MTRPGRECLTSSQCGPSFDSIESGSLMRRPFWSALWLGVCVCMLSPTLARADIISSFDSNSENWQVVSFTNLTTSDLSVSATYTPTFNAAGGNPGGYISTTDQDNGDLTFAAPTKFLGDVSSATGLSYDLIYPGVGVNYQPTDVILMGNGETLLWKANPDIVPGSAWSTTHVNFIASTEWRVGTSSGAFADASDFANVLGNLTGLYIRGEFTTGLVENPGLDNVELSGVSPVPEPSTLALTGLATLSLVMFRRYRRTRHSMAGTAA